MTGAGVRMIPNVWIPMPDGVRLAARMWLPEAAEATPVPAILEYLPYRKGDGTAPRDALVHPYFAQHGYGAVRVDIRGTGDSDGILLDEYLVQEQDDALVVLAWLAEQPWCNGAVGILGKSWGGFNGLQIAARRPPQLKAVISVCSTDDRYADDVHYLGGCVLGSKMLPWASTMLAMNALPPDPDVVGDSWRELWRQRVERTPSWVEAWLSHQRRDAYWSQGSVCEDFSAIACPVYLVGGWADGYTNAILRLLEGLTCPRKGLIGPWGHQYPQSGVPGPAIGFLQECVRWWDHWLRGVDTGVMKEPPLRAWMQDWVQPAAAYARRPGRWVTEPAWPSPNVEPRVVALGPGTLVEGPGPEVPHAIRGIQTCGMDAGDWCPGGAVGELPPDQRREDGQSLSFDSAPLEEGLELLGFPEASLTVSADRPLALIAVRLCDVAPDGASLLVARGVLNLTHREGHEEPRPLEPGRSVTVTVRLGAAGHTVPAGHRVRLAVSPTYWPWAWPSPDPVTLTVFSGHGSRLELPVRRPHAGDPVPAPFGPPETGPGLELESRLDAPAAERLVSVDLGARRTELRRVSRESSLLVDAGLQRSRERTETFAITEDDPLSATVTSDSTQTLARGDWRITVVTRTAMTCDRERFYVTSVIEAFEGDEVFARREQARSVPRDLG
jgi:putative CocE/NonD family hydrolase